ncbi:MAG: 5-oxoprolinase subunit PxpB [Actinomycetota bacterium]
MSAGPDARIYPLGDRSLVVSFGDDIDLDTHREVRTLADHLERSPPGAMLEYIPAFTTVTVLFDPLGTTYQAFEAEIRALLAGRVDGERDAGRVVEIPVCYGHELGPDLDFVARHNGLSAEEVVRIHHEPEYLVYMIGFSPGFPYLGGMSSRIAAPRRESPRKAIPAGTVGIAGQQTGVYPIETPGGWQLIGRTPLRLFRPELSPPSLLRVGDAVRFEAISRDAYLEWDDDR